LCSFAFLAVALCLPCGGWAERERESCGRVGDAVCDWEEGIGIERWVLQCGKEESWKDGLMWGGGKDTKQGARVF